MQKLTMREKLLLHVEASNPCACWKWTARKNASGYGVCAAPAGKGNALAHRVAWEAFVGPIPDGLEVCHHCDTPDCINPDHLFIGTHAENMADCRMKGRAQGNPGEKNGRNKLTEENVRFIRTAHGSHSALARRFDVSHTLIRFIRLRKAWKHVA
jgi:hypothetical protein